MKPRTEFLLWGWLRLLPLFAIGLAILKGAWPAAIAFGGLYGFCLWRMSCLFRGRA